MYAIHRERYTEHPRGRLYLQLYYLLKSFANCSENTRSTVRPTSRRFFKIEADVGPMNLYGNVRRVEEVETLGQVASQGFINMKRLAKYHGV